MSLVSHATYMPLLTDGFKLQNATKKAYAFGILAEDWLGNSSKSSVEVLVGREYFLALRDDWIRLVSADPQATPFMNWDWVQSWSNAYGVGREFLTLVVRESGSIVAIVPFTWKLQVSPLEIRKLWMLAFDPNLSTNGLTEEPVFAMADGSAFREKIWSLVHMRLRALVDSGRWDAIAYRKFGRGFEGGSVIQVRDDSIETEQYWRGSEYISLPADWQVFKKGLSKSMRENIPYYRRRLKKDGHEYLVRFVQPHQASKAIDHLVRLHKLRTYADSTMQHVDYFGDDRQVQLLKEAAVRMTAQGSMRIAVLKVGRNVIAAQAFLVDEKSVIAHYSGFDPKWSKYSPLFILQSHVFEEMLKAGVQSLNLLRGNADWQRRWGASSRNQIVDVSINRRTLVPRIRQSIQYHESRIMHKLSNNRTVRRTRASYRSWKLNLNVG